MPQKILIMLFGDLGDTILTVPAIRAIRRRYPRARIVLLGKATAAAYVTALGLADDCVVIDKHLWDRLSSVARPSGLWWLFLLLRRLRREDFDTVVLFHHLVTRWGALKFGLLSLATGAPQRIGIDNGRGWFLTDAVQDRGFGDRHEAQYYLDVAGLLDATGTLELEASVCNENRRSAATLLEPVEGKRIVAIHPGTGWYGPGRKWSPQRFARSAQLVRASEDVAFVIVGSDDDRCEADALLRDLRGDVVDLSGQTSVGVLGAVLERSALLLANDGGVGHLAAAVGTPVVSVFGPSNDRAWRPLTGVVVSAELPCRPCFYRDFERGLPHGCATRECMQLVTPGMVAQAALSILHEEALVD